MASGVPGVGLVPSAPGPSARLPEPGIARLSSFSIQSPSPHQGRCKRNALPHQLSAPKPPSPPHKRLPELLSEAIQGRASLESSLIGGFLARRRCSR